MFNQLLAALLLATQVLAQSASGNWTQPAYISLFQDHASVVVGSNVDVNGDGLPDVVKQTHDGNDGKFYGATYLNTGKGYCMAYESAAIVAERVSTGVPVVPNCSSVPSMTMHDPKEDKRVTEFLASIGLEEYTPAFAEHKVDYETLLELTDADLEKMGLRALGSRKRILKAAKVMAKKRKDKLVRLNDPGPQRNNCPAGSPTNYTLPTAMVVRYGGQSNSENVCSFQDINGDGLPEYVCASEEEGHEGDTNDWNVRCTYMNTGKGWALV